MIIRQTQMASFSATSLRAFENRVAEHLQRCFPAACKAWGEMGVRDVIRYGIGQSASHAIDLERDVCKYIDLMVAFGRDFDCDPQLPWASRILADDTFCNSTVKVDRLFAVAKSRPRSEAWSPRQ